ncbi:hypothetical protein [Aliamphritea spongicola]|nr:hypothetical protein [Aliamphritea spongicola]
MHIREELSAGALVPLLGDTQQLLASPIAIILSGLRALPIRWLKRSVTGWQASLTDRKLRWLLWEIPFVAS